MVITARTAAVIERMPRRFIEQFIAAAHRSIARQALADQTRMLELLAGVEVREVGASEWADTVASFELMTAPVAQAA